MAQSTLNVVKRVRMGKSGARAIRKEGNVPAILYGKGEDPLALVINPGDLKEALSTEAGENTLLEIVIENDSDKVKKLSLLREIQYDYLTSKPIHFDFQTLDVKKKITVTVPVIINGRAKGVKEGGILEEVHREISVECLPTNIPNSFEIDVTELEVGQSIHVSALEVEEGVSILNDLGDTIVSVQAPRVEKVTTTAEEEEGEGEEGEGTEATEETSGEE